MLNQWVLHRLYGVGQIVKIQGDLATVRFSEWEKTFGLSQAIPQGALKLLNPNVEAQFKAQLAKTTTPATSKPKVAPTTTSDFTIDETYTNAQINAHFVGQTSGRIRRGEQALVLIAEADDQRNAQGQLLFTGVGTTGDQSLTKAPNKTLAHAGDTLLHVFAPAPHRAYTYLGQAQCAGEPVATTQPDRHGTDRKVWQFPLQFK